MILGSASAKLPDGRVIIGGNLTTGTVEVYTPASGTWAMTTEIIRERTLFTMTVFPNGVVLIVGGLSNDTVMDEYLASCEYYMVPAASGQAE